MLGTHKLIVDRWAEIWDLLEPYADASFDKWPDQFDPTAVYVVGRMVLQHNWLEITQLATRYPGRIIFSNPAEGSYTILWQLKRLRIDDLVRDGRMGLLCSGELEPGFDPITTDVYFSNIVTYLENQAAREHWHQVYTGAKPYQFLMLNGRLRPHRKWLIDGMRGRGLLDQALWTNLNRAVSMPWSSQLATGTQEPVRLLPAQYEIASADLGRVDHAQNFVKTDLFHGLAWGDAVINPRAYIDTCFSVVTETVFDYPYVFRTEKIWKPVIMCHPFVVASSAGYYRSLHDAGFRTFGNLIDEGFDGIDDPTARAQRIVDVVADICYNGAMQFLEAARPACEHNYQQLLAHNQQERDRLPQQIQKYLDERLGIS